MREIDLAQVQQLESSAQKDPWSLNHFADELGNPVARIDVYWCQGQLAGYLCSWLIAGELQIQNIVTSPTMRRRGIAARLLSHVMERGRGEGMTSIWLEVRASNSAAISLYKRFWFAEAGKRAAYYPDGEDALMMTWNAQGQETH